MKLEMKRSDKPQVLAEKRDYQTPEVHKYGNLGDLTRAVVSVGNNTDGTIPINKTN